PRGRGEVRRRPLGGDEGPRPRTESQAPAPVRPRAGARSSGLRPESPPGFGPAARPVPARTGKGGRGLPVAAHVPHARYAHRLAGGGGGYRRGPARIPRAGPRPAPAPR